MPSELNPCPFERVARAWKRWLAMEDLIDQQRDLGADDEQLNARLDAKLDLWMKAHKATRELDANAACHRPAPPAPSDLEAEIEKAWVALWKDYDPPTEGINDAEMRLRRFGFRDGYRACAAAREADGGFYGRAAARLQMKLKERDAEIARLKAELAERGEVGVVQALKVDHGQLSIRRDDGSNLYLHSFIGQRVRIVVEGKR